MTVRRHDFGATCIPRPWSRWLRKPLSTHFVQKYLLPIAWFRKLLTTPGPKLECQIIGCSRVAICEFVNGPVRVYVCIWHKHRFMEELTE